MLKRFLLALVLLVLGVLIWNMVTNFQSRHQAAPAASATPHDGKRLQPLLRTPHSIRPAFLRVISRSRAIVAVRRATSRAAPIRTAPP